MADGIRDELAAIREDVAYIRAKVEILPDHEDRLRKVEKRQWGMPAGVLVALMAALGVHIS
jgi:hypothetical protein